MPTDRILTLHIGTQKTASTLIRRFLKANADCLASHDIKLVDRTTLTESDFFAYLETVTDGTVSAQTPMPSAIAENLEHLVAGDFRHVLMTSEIMFHRLPLGDFYDRIADGLQMIQTALPDWTIRVIFFVRSQKAFVESCYTQLIQMGKRTRFSVYTGGGVPKHLNWARVCDDISRQIGTGNLIVRPFEIIRDMGTEPFLRSFLGHLDLDATQAATFQYDAALAEGQAANRGFSEVAVKLARFTMPLVDPGHRKKLRKFLQENYSTADYPRPHYFTDTEAADMAAHYRAENARLFATYIRDLDPETHGY
jgi:hypothetical protein